MRHYDEHTLSSYVLGLKSVAAERQAIAAHLGECNGCREIAETLGAIYAEAQAEMETAPAESGDEPGELMRISGERGLRHARWSGDIEPAGAPIGRRVMRYVYRHPVVSGATGLAGIFLLVLSGHVIQQKLSSAAAGLPSAYNYNEQGTGIDIRDAKGAVLWTIPTNAAISARYGEANTSATWTQVVDLEGNGRPLVITSTAYIDGSRSVTNHLRVFDERGKSLFMVPLGRKISFRGDEYPQFFGSGPFATIRAEGGRPGEIIACSPNYRSPCGIYRVTDQGDVRGEYWHYGWLTGSCVTTLAGMDHEVVALSGINEVNDKADSAVGVIIVVDPGKINGLTESTASRGFGFQPSQAELYYIRAELPRLPVNPDSSVGKEAFARSGKVGQDGTMTFICNYRVVGGRPNVLYTFDNRMTLQGVFVDDNSRELLKGRYLRDHSSAAFQEFLDEARAGVSYWDGREWTRTPTGVNESLVASGSSSN